MSGSVAGNMACPGCGASYPWKPQLEGRKVRCKCGVAFEASAPKALEAFEPAEETVLALRENDASIVRSSNTSTAIPPGSTPGLSGPTLESLMSPYPTHRRVKPHVQEEEPASQKKWVVFSAIAALLLGGGIFMGIALKGDMFGNANLKGDDATIVGMIKDDGATEIREWINGSARHMVLNQTDGQVLNLADQLYSLGAVQVLAFGETITATLAVEMPTDPAKRKALLEFEQKHNRSRTPIADVGQKYFLLRMM